MALNLLNLEADMKNSVYRIVFSLASVSWIACGGNTDAFSPSSSINNPQVFASQTLGNVQWDGQGTEFSGNYLFTFSESTLRCPAMRDINFPANASIYRCIQKDVTFACGKPEEEVGAESLRGTISKDGKFLLTHITPGNQGDMVNGLRNGEVKIFLAGALNKEFGQAQYSMILQNSQRQGACVSNARLSVQTSH